MTETSTTDYTKQYQLKLTKAQLEDLSIVTQISQQYVGEVDSVSCLDLPILVEVQQLIDKKAEKVKNKSTLTLTTSQSIVLFNYMNTLTFEHPMFNTLTYTVVNQLYKQNT